MNGSPLSCKKKSEALGVTKVSDPMGPIWTGFCENKKKKTMRTIMDFSWGTGWWQLKDFLCSPLKLGKIPILTHMFQRG